MKKVSDGRHHKLCLHAAIRHGCKAPKWGPLYFFAAGTTTPQSAFQDTALTLPYPNPITLDASGRVPMFYLADGNIKIRLTDSNGVTVIAADQLLVVGPSSGGGGGSSVDPTAIMQTGDFKARYGTGTLTGFVRANGLPSATRLPAVPSPSATSVRRCSSICGSSPISR